MADTRTHNSMRNIVFGLLNRMVSIFFPFIVRTIFIKFLGESYLGLSSLFSSILQVLNLADLGFASAIVASMYKPISDGNVSKVSALLNLYRRIYRIIGVAILLLGCLLTPFVGKLINGEPPEDINIYIIWILYLSNTVVSYLLFAYKVSLINAHQRSDISEKIGTLCRIFISILQIVTIILFKNIYLYVFLIILNSVIYNLWCSRECDKRFPQYRCYGKLDIENKRKITKNVSALALQKIGNTVSTSLDSIVISAFLGLTAVAIYGNYYYIVTSIAIFIGLIYSSITASIGNSIAIETSGKNYADFKKIFFLTIWITGWCCVCLACLFQDFMIVWMGENLMFGMGTVLALIIRFYFEQIRKAVLTYKDAAGIWWADKWRPLIGCLLNLTLNIILVKTIGVAGVMLSTIISYIFVEIPWETHVLFRLYFKKGVQEYYIELIRATVTMVVAGILTYYICTFFCLSHIASIAVKFLICIIVPNGVFAFLNWNNNDFKDSIQFIKEIFIRVSQDKH